MNVRQTAVVIALVSAVIGGLYRWPSVASVSGPLNGEALLPHVALPSNYEDTLPGEDVFDRLRRQMDVRNAAIPDGQHWVVDFLRGGVLLVRRQADTATVEAVMRSHQVVEELGRRKRRLMVELLVQGALVFFGVIAVDHFRRATARAGTSAANTERPI